MSAWLIPLGIALGIVGIVALAVTLFIRRLDKIQLHFRKK